jgi:hypothetical protein
MTYEVLVIIAVINAAATLLLWQKVASKSIRGRPKLTKKAATALWRSQPIIPKHDPPKTVGGEYSSLAGNIDRQFFANFMDFAHVLNWWFTDAVIASRFRLQDLPDGDLRLNVDHSRTNDHSPAGTIPRCDMRPFSWKVPETLPPRSISISP